MSAVPVAFEDSVWGYMLNSSRKEQINTFLELVP